MSRSVASITFSDQNPPPRVSLIGPKGCGKTIYRTYLFGEANTELPDCVRSTLGVTQADLSKDGEVYEDSNGGGWGWVPERDQGQRDAVDGHLPVIDPTTHLTRHLLALPLSSGEAVQAGLVYDFPGAFWDVDGREDDGAKQLIINALRESRVIVMMLPYWTLIPKALRRSPSPLALARGQADGQDVSFIRSEQAKREELLRTGALKWLKLLKVARRGAARPATVFITLSMLHREWRHELLGPDAAPAQRDAVQQAVEHVRTLRRLITQPLLNLESKPGSASQPVGGWLPFVGPESRLSLRHLIDAIALRGLLEQLHDAVARYVLEMEGLCRRLGHGENATLEAVQALRGVERSSLAYSFRYGAMNVVSEREARRGPLPPQPERGGAMPVVAKGEAEMPVDESRARFRRYMKVEKAAAMLPSLYLCGSLDDLC